MSAAALTTVGLGTVPAEAKPQGFHRNISDSALAPFQIAVSQGVVYAADGFAGTLTQYPKKGEPTVTEIPGVVGIDVSSNQRTVAYTSATETSSYLTIQTKGKPDVVADLGVYEATQNPDQINTYGIVEHSCDPAEVPDFLLPYTGDVNSNPYSAALLRDGSVAVADAGGNTILRVTTAGAISTLAVLPPQRTVITQEGADALGLPECLVGGTFDFEPVPTDVEEHNGKLYVSTLPGGPEDGSLGARGSVYVVDPANGSSTQLATGFLGATNLAVLPNGKVYVAELFGNKVTSVFRGERETVTEIDRPVAVEYWGGSLYIGTMGDIEFPEEGPPIIHGPGSIFQIDK